MSVSGFDSWRRGAASLATLSLLLLAAWGCGGDPSDVHRSEEARVLYYADGPDGAEAYYLAAGDLEAGTAGVPLQPYALGEQRTLMVLLNFEDAPLQPWSPAEADEAVFTGLDGYVREASYGQAWVTGDVAGWYTVPLSSTVCSTADIERLGKAAAVAEGYDLDAYDRFLFAFPENGCGWNGFARVGGIRTSAFFNGNITAGVLAHEFGHNLGLAHAMALDCGAESVGESCTYLAYGDTADVMGMTSRGAHYNAAGKHVLRWIGSPERPAVATAEAGGTFTIAPLVDGSSPDPRAVRVPAGWDAQTGEQLWYYLEYRQGQGHDAALANLPGMVGGVLVRLARPYGGGFSTMLLDMTPQSAGGQADWDDPALLPGRTFSDAANGVTVRVLEADAWGAQVQVEVATSAAPPEEDVPPPEEDVPPPPEDEVPVPEVNQPPEVTDDEATTPYRTLVNLAPLDNDHDPDGDALTVVSIGAPSHGEASLEFDGTVTYVPAHKFSGIDAFSYTVSDGEATRTGTIRITVHAEVKGKGRPARR